MGMGMGFAMGNQMAQAMPQACATPAASGQAPPPLPGQGVQFHIAIGGQQIGPLDLAAIKAKIASGDITRDTLVWKAGMPQWTPASQVVELHDAFGAVPPPLPPQP
jgi:hypothetical protein